MHHTGRKGTHKRLYPGLLDAHPLLGSFRKGRVFTLPLCRITPDGNEKKV